MSTMWRDKGGGPVPAWSLWLAPFLLVVILSPVQSEVTISLNTRRVIGVVDERFLSFTVDPEELIRRNYGPISRSMAQALAPAYLRIAGPSSNNFTLEGDRININSNAINVRSWRELNTFLNHSGIDVVVCLNILQRSHNVWDSSNAMEIVAALEKTGLQVDYQLGYENQEYLMELSSEELSHNIIRLRSILDTFSNTKLSRIVGPDFTQFDLSSTDQLAFVKNFIKSFSLEKDVSTAVLKAMDTFDETLFSKIGARKKPIWLGESELEEKLSGFEPTLNSLVELGVAAQSGAEMFLLRPQPFLPEHTTSDFWMAALHKALVGNIVLSLKQSTSPQLKTFVHCTKPTSTDNPNNYEAGSVTIFGANLDPNEPSNVTVKSSSLRDEAAHIFVLTYDEQTGKSYLNDKELSIASNGELPIITPIEKELIASSLGKGSVDNTITIPKRSIFFIVLPENRARSCISKYRPSSITQTLLNGNSNVKLTNKNFVSKLVDFKKTDRLKDHFMDTPEEDFDWTLPKYNPLVKDTTTEGDVKTKYVTFSDNNWLSKFPEKVHKNTLFDDEFPKNSVLNFNKYNRYRRHKYSGLYDDDSLNDQEVPSDEKSFRESEKENLDTYIKGDHIKDSEHGVHDEFENKFNMRDEKPDEIIQSMDIPYESIQTDDIKSTGTFEDNPFSNDEIRSTDEEENLNKDGYFGNVDDDIIDELHNENSHHGEKIENIDEQDYQNSDLNHKSHEDNIDLDILKGNIKRATTKEKDSSSERIKFSALEYDTEEENTRNIGEIKTEKPPSEEDINYDVLLGETENRNSPYDNLNLENIKESENDNLEEESSHEIDNEEDILNNTSSILQDNYDGVSTHETIENIQLKNRNEMDHKEILSDPEDDLVIKNDPVNQEDISELDQSFNLDRNESLDDSENKTGKEDSSKSPMYNLSRNENDTGNPCVAENSKKQAEKYTNESTLKEDQTLKSNFENSTKVKEGDDLKEENKVISEEEAREYEKGITKSQRTTTDEDDKTENKVFKTNIMKIEKSKRSKRQVHKDGFETTFKENEKEEKQNDKKHKDTKKEQQHVKRLSPTDENEKLIFVPQITVFDSNFHKIGVLDSENKKEKYPRENQTTNNMDITTPHTLEYDGTEKSNLEIKSTDTISNNEETAGFDISRKDYKNKARIEHSEISDGTSILPEKAPDHAHPPIIDSDKEKEENDLYKSDDFTSEEERAVITRVTENRKRSPNFNHYFELSEPFSMLSMKGTKSLVDYPSYKNIIHHAMSYSPAKLNDKDLAHVAKPGITSLLPKHKSYNGNKNNLDGGSSKLGTAQETKTPKTYTVNLKDTKTNYQLNNNFTHDTALNHSLIVDVKKEANKVPNNEQNKPVIIDEKSFTTRHNHTLTNNSSITIIGQEDEIIAKNKTSNIGTIAEPNVSNIKGNTTEDIVSTENGNRTPVTQKGKDLKFDGDVVYKVKNNVKRDHGSLKNDYESVISKILNENKEQEIMNYQTNEKDFEKDPEILEPIKEDDVNDLIDTNPMANNFRIDTSEDDSLEPTTMRINDRYNLKKINHLENNIPTINDVSTPSSDIWNTNMEEEQTDVDSQYSKEEEFVETVPKKNDVYRTKIVIDNNEDEKDFETNLDEDIYYMKGINGMKNKVDKGSKLFSSTLKVQRKPNNNYQDQEELESEGEDYLEEDESAIAEKLNSIKNRNSKSKSNKLKTDEKGDNVEDDQDEESENSENEEGSTFFKTLLKFKNVNVSNNMDNNTVYSEKPNNTEGNNRNNSQNIDVVDNSSTNSGSISSDSKDRGVVSSSDSQAKANIDFNKGNNIRNEMVENYQNTSGGEKLSKIDGKKPDQDTNPQTHYPTQEKVQQKRNIRNINNENYNIGTGTNSKYYKLNQNKEYVQLFPYIYNSTHNQLLDFNSNQQNEHLLIPKVETVNNNQETIAPQINQEIIVPQITINSPKNIEKEEFTTSLGSIPKLPSIQTEKHTIDPIFAQVKSVQDEININTNKDHITEYHPTQVENKFFPSISTYHDESNLPVSTTEKVPTEVGKDESGTTVYKHGYHTDTPLLYNFFSNQQAKENTVPLVYPSTIPKEQINNDVDISKSYTNAYDYSKQEVIRNNPHMDHITHNKIEDNVDKSKAKFMPKKGELNAMENKLNNKQKEIVTKGMKPSSKEHNTKQVDVISEMKKAIFPNGINKETAKKPKTLKDKLRERSKLLREKFKKPKSKKEIDESDINNSSADSEEMKNGKKSEEVFDRKVPNFSLNKKEKQPKVTLPIEKNNKKEIDNYEYLKKEEEIIKEKGKQNSLMDEIPIELLKLDHDLELEEIKRNNRGLLSSVVTKPETEKAIQVADKILGGVQNFMQKIDPLAGQDVSSVMKEPKKKHKLNPKVNPTKRKLKVKQSQWKKNLLKPTKKTPIRRAPTKSNALNLQKNIPALLFPKSKRNIYGYKDRFDKKHTISKRDISNENTIVRNKIPKDRAINIRQDENEHLLNVIYNESDGQKENKRFSRHIASDLLHFDPLSDDLTISDTIIDDFGSPNNEQLTIPDQSKRISDYKMPDYMLNGNAYHFEENIQNYDNLDRASTKVDDISQLNRQSTDTKNMHIDYFKEIQNNKGTNCNNKNSYRKNMFPKQENLGYNFQTSPNDKETKMNTVSGINDFQDTPDVNDVYEESLYNLVSENNLVNDIDNLVAPANANIEYEDREKEIIKNLLKEDSDTKNIYKELNYAINDKNEEPNRNKRQASDIMSRDGELLDFSKLNDNINKVLLTTVSDYYTKYIRNTNTNMDLINTIIGEIINDDYYKENQFSNNVKPEVTLDVKKTSHENDHGNRSEFLLDNFIHQKRSKDYMSRSNENTDKDFVTEKKYGKYTDKERYFSRNDDSMKATGASKNAKKIENKTNNKITLLPVLSLHPPNQMAIDNKIKDANNENLLQHDSIKKFLNEEIKTDLNKYDEAVRVKRYVDNTNNEYIDNDNEKDDVDIQLLKTNEVKKFNYFPKKTSKHMFKYDQEPLDNVLRINMNDKINDINSLDKTIETSLNENHKEVKSSVSQEEKSTQSKRLESVTRNNVNATTNENMFNLKQTDKRNMSPTKENINVPQRLFKLNHNKSKRIHHVRIPKIRTFKIMENKSIQPKLPISEKNYFGNNLLKKVQHHDIPRKKYTIYLKNVNRFKRAKRAVNDNVTQQGQTEETSRNTFEPSNLLNVNEYAKNMYSTVNETSKYNTSENVHKIADKKIPIYSESDILNMIPKNEYEKIIFDELTKSKRKKMNETNKKGKLDQIVPKKIKNEVDLIEYIELKKSEMNKEMKNKSEDYDIEKKSDTIAINNNNDYIKKYQNILNEFMKHGNNIAPSSVGVNNLNNQIELSFDDPIDRDIIKDIQTKDESEKRAIFDDDFQKALIHNSPIVTVHPSDTSDEDIIDTIIINPVNEFLTKINENIRHILNATSKNKTNPQKEIAQHGLSLLTSINNLIPHDDVRTSNFQEEIESEDKKYEETGNDHLIANSDSAQKGSVILNKTDTMKDDFQKTSLENHIDQGQTNISTNNQTEDSSEKSVRDELYQTTTNKTDSDLNVLTKEKTVKKKNRKKIKQDKLPDRNPEENLSYVEKTHVQKAQGIVVNVFENVLQNLGRVFS
ncbi:hypothetical protein M8J76_014967 [Diaphorina citri]|nr:hypothetical protein M8J76_014967 [Diaphorina citri]